VTASELDTPYVICVGTSPDETAAVTRALSGQAVVIAASDALTLRPLLDGAEPGSPTAAPRTVGRGPLTIDHMLRQVTWDDQVVDLSPREFDLLSLLARDTGRVWTFQEITTTAWRIPFLGDADAVLSAVKRLRRRLARVTTDVEIRSVRGIGFRLVICREDAPAPGAPPAPVAV